MMPNMSSTLAGFEETVVFEIVKTTVVDHDVVQTSKVAPTLYFEGVLLPITPQKLLVKPEGERKWKWWTLYTDLRLATDDIVKDEQGALYRVMSINDWRQAGYYQYELTEGPGVDE